MVQLTGRTLAIAIQAVHAEMRRLDEQIRSGDHPDQEPDLQDLTLAYSLAAEELRSAYLPLLEPGTNLPRYSDLVR